MFENRETRSSHRFVAFACVIALAALLVCAVVFDPHAGESGIDGGLFLKSAVLQIAGFAAAIVVLIGFVATGRASFAFAPFDLLMFAYVSWAALSAQWAVNGDDARRDALMLVAAAFVAVLIRTEVVRNGPARAIAAILGGAVLAAITDIVSIAQRADGVTLEGAAKFGSRVFPHQNIAALAYGAPAAIALVLACSPMRRSARIGYAAVATTLAGALFLAGSKGSLIGLVFGPAAFLIAERGVGRFERLEARCGKAMARVGLFVAVAFAGVAAVLLPRQRDVSAFLKESFNRTIDFFELNYHAAYMRPELWKKTFSMFDDHPALGVGLANFQNAIPLYDLTEPVRPHAHNQWLQSLAELGVPGLLLVVGLFVLPCLVALLVVRRRETTENESQRFHRLTVRAVGCGFFVFALQSLFEPPLGFAFGCLLFFTRGAIATSSGVLERGVDLRQRPLLRFAFAPAIALAIALQWVPNSVVSLAQGEATRAGLALEQRGDLEGARERYQKALSGYENFAVHGLLAAIEAKRERFEPALASYRRALAVAPNQWSLHLQVAVCLIELGRPTAAVAALDKAEALQPGRAEIRFWRGRAELAEGDLDVAIDQLESYRQGVAENTETLRYCADAYYQRTRRDLSLEDAKAAHERYSRYRALGGKGGDGWVRERIDELGHWLRLGQVLPDAGATVPQSDRNVPRRPGG